VRAGRDVAGRLRLRLSEQALLSLAQDPALGSRLSFRKVLLMLLGAISRSIASHTCRARSGASAAANTAMICW
jgi:hypothetical protein